MLCGRAWPTWCGKRTPVSTADRRTVRELLAESDALARETLPDATLEHAPVDEVKGMIDSFSGRSTTQRFRTTSSRRSAAVETLMAGLVIAVATSRARVTYRGSRTDRSAESSESRVVREKRSAASTFDRLI